MTSHAVVFAKWLGYCGIACLALLPPATVAHPFSDFFQDLKIRVPKQRILAPDFNLNDLQGNSITLSDYRGKIVLVNFWASFCAPCREEMPALEALWRQFQADGFVVIAIAVDRGNKSVVEKFIKTGDFSFPLPLDSDGTIRKQYEVTALPMTYLIGGDGKFLGRALGAREWASEQGQALIRDLLNKN